MSKPRLIAIEGLSATGKTTVSKDLVATVENSTYVKLLPSDTERGVEIRKNQGIIPPLELDRLYVEDLYVCMEETSRFLSQARTVFFDRYLPSLFSFWRCFKNRRDCADLMRGIDYGKILVPDILVLLTASLEVRAKRMRNKDDASEFDIVSLENTSLEKFLCEEARKYNPHIVDNSELSTQETLLAVQRAIYS